MRLNFNRRVSNAELEKARIEKEMLEMKLQHEKEMAIMKLEREKIMKQLKEQQAAKNDPVTPKQETFIKMMENTFKKYYGKNTNKVFKGSTKAQASAWISKNVDDYNNIIDKGTKIARILK